MFSLVSLERRGEKWRPGREGLESWRRPDPKSVIQGCPRVAPPHLPVTREAFQPKSAQVRPQVSRCTAAVTLSHVPHPHPTPCLHLSREGEPSPGHSTPTHLPSLEETWSYRSPSDAPSSRQASLTLVGDTSATCAPPPQPFSHSVGACAQHQFLCSTEVPFRWDLSRLVQQSLVP